MMSKYEQYDYLLVHLLIMINMKKRKRTIQLGQIKMEK